MIEVTTPTTQPTQTYTGWWIQNITIIAPSPTAIASARVAMCPYDPTSGALQPGGFKQFVIADLFGAAVVDPVTGAAVGSAITALIAAVQAVAAQRNLL
jgi:hypothetical protein